MKNFIVLLFVVLQSLCTCFCSTNDAESNGNVYSANYNIIEEEKIFTTSTGGKYTFPYIQVSGLQNTSLENKINQNLMDVVKICESNTDECEVIQDIGISIKTKDSKYLSVLYNLALDVEEDERVKNGSIRIGLTISMKSGERVFLDNLFASDKAYSEYQNSNREFPMFSSPLSSDEFESIFELASISETEYINRVRMEDDLVNQFLLSYLRVKPTFYIDSDSVTITASSYYMDDISLVRKS